MDVTAELTYFFSCSNLTQEYLIGQSQMGKEGLQILGHIQGEIFCVMNKLILLTLWKTHHKMEDAFLNSANQQLINQSLHRQTHVQPLHDSGHQVAVSASKCY